MLTIHESELKTPDAFDIIVGEGGIVVDPGKAKDPMIPCKGFEAAGKIYAFKKGIIGMITGPEIDEFCPTIVYPEDEKMGRLEQRIETIGEISRKCSGMDIKTRLKCLRDEFEMAKIKM